MSEKIYCKDCRFCENGFCHRMPPGLVSWHKDALFPKVDDFDWCGMAERKEDAEPTNQTDEIFVSTSENGKDGTRVNGIPMETFILRLHQKVKDLNAENKRLRGLIAEIREFLIGGAIPGKVHLKQEYIREIYTIASEQAKN